jgi:cell division protein DivIC
MKKISNKAKFRVIFLTLGCIITSVIFVSTLVSLNLQIEKTKNEIKELEVSYSDKLEEEENLKEEITRLQDPEYMAKYAREKYLYSKDNEIILKIEE